ncbi:prepilin-type N-terminal cleavage/methylation domain-containing protein, partial [Patescibacteria group bacterium]|nr:prepilin-type N-terminal cleavage/methylation domain-containing protein [Patescibacteria group bacterium]
MKPEDKPKNMNCPKVEKIKFNERGLTLIEMLITLVVFGIVIASLSTLYYEMQVSQVKTAHY